MPFSALMITRWPDYLYIACLFRSSIAYGALCGIALRPCFLVIGTPVLVLKIRCAGTYKVTSLVLDIFYLVSVSGDNPRLNLYMIY